MQGRLGVDNVREIHRDGKSRLKVGALTGSLRRLEGDAEQGVSGVPDHGGVRGTRTVWIREYRVGPGVDRGDRTGSVQIVREPRPDRR